MSTVGKLRTITTIHDYIKEGEMEAVELVLKFFYDKGEPPLDTLPSEIDAKVPLLLKALMVAERYQADRCKEKIAEALSSIPATYLSYQAVKQSLQLPDSLRDIPPLSGFMNSTSTLLARRFGNLSSIIKCNAQRRKEFLELSFNAILAWIKSDDLKVLSENDVVYLLDRWIDANKPSPDQRRALINKIRVINLGPAYLQFVLPHLSWLDDNALAKDALKDLLRSIYFFKSMNLTDWSLERLRERMPRIPHCWLSPPRLYKVDLFDYLSDRFAINHTPFTLILRADQLKQLYEGEVVYTKPVYNNGHWIKGAVQRSKLKEEENYTLYVGIEIDALMLEAWQTLQHEIYMIQISSTVSIGGLRYDIPLVEKEGDLDILDDDESGYGWRDFLDRKCPTIQEVVAPYLFDGELKINFDIHQVDLPTVID